MLSKFIGYIKYNSIEGVIKGGGKAEVIRVLFLQSLLMLPALLGVAVYVALDAYRTYKAS